MKHQVPSSKLQRSTKHQTPNQDYCCGAELMIEIWNFSGAWSLELGAFSK
jgi:hypothetical protein